MNKFIQKMPKAELHLHIEGTLEPELMFQLAKRNSLTLPYASVTAARAAYDFSDLQSFLNIYYAGMRVLIEEQDFYDLTWAYLQKAKAENIRHTEIFFDPQAHLDRGIPFEKIINGIHRALVDGENKLGISNHLIMCFLRDLSEESAQQTLELALPYKDWIIGVGLDSAEIHNPPSKFENVFQHARQAGFLTVAHAGEEGPVEFIWQALELLKVSRIDHGVKCVNDPKLVKYLKTTEVPLTVCPISNIKLKIFKTMQDHPLKKMLEAGLCVTINSDDPAYFAGYVNQNFIATNDALQFTKHQLYQMARNSFIACFLDNSRKQALLNEIDHYYSNNGGEN